MLEGSRIAVYSVPCVLIWGADATFGEADTEGVVGRSTRDAYVAEADMEAFALWGVTDWAP